MKRFLLPIAAAVIGTAAHAQAVEAGQEDSLRMYRLQEIEVTATRADAATPVAYTDIARDEIARNSFGSDIPSVLALTPSMVATNETGIGIGATSVRLRGTDATRLNVTINGVSMNNPDSHSMYWYDTPDLISSVGTVQVQRGAGISTNGTGAFGGAVNMTTEALPTDFNGSASLSYGSYNTNKQAVQVSSGLMGGHWAVDARLTHIGSDGYIDRGATDLKSYMFQAGYYNGNTMLKLISFGGKAKTGLTYTGATKEEMRLNGRRFHTEGMYYTSNGPHSYYYMKDGERQRATVDYYDDQTDNYLQINNQLVLSHRFNEKWTLNATGFYTYGYGFYKQYKDARTLSEYLNIPTDVAAGKEADLVREKIMRNHLGGVNAAASGGLTIASTAGMPLVMAGAAEYTISGCTGSALGMRLSTLSIENGHKSRTAASAHRAHSSHFGAFLNASRTSTTAKIRTAADRLRLRKPRNTSVMAASPHSHQSWRAVGQPHSAKALSCAQTLQQMREANPQTSFQPVRPVPPPVPRLWRRARRRSHFRFSRRRARPIGG